MAASEDNRVKGRELLKKSYFTKAGELIGYSPTFELTKHENGEAQIKNIKRLAPHIFLGE